MTPMMKTLLCVIIAMFSLAACGKKAADEAPAPAEPAQQAAAPPSAPTPDAEPPEPVPALKDSVAGPEGETVDTGTTTTSPIAAAVAANTPAAPASEPLRWQKGENYTELAVAQPTSAAPGNIEVIEGFWYGCACRSYSMKSRARMRGCITRSKGSVWSTSFTPRCFAKYTSAAGR
jgi:subtilisin family serine protease